MSNSAVARLDTKSNATSYAMLSSGTIITLASLCCNYLNKYILLYTSKPYIDYNKLLL